MQQFLRNRILLGALILVAVVAFGLGRLTVTERPQPTAPSDAEATHKTTVDVSEAALTLMNIKLERAVRGNVSAEITAPAIVSSAVNNSAVVTAHAAGTVSRVNKRLGDGVEADEVLALVASRDAAALAADRRAADAKATLARSVVKRERELFEQHVTPRQDLEAAEAQLEAADAEAARAQQAAQSAQVAADGKFLEVVSPIAGRITEARAALGAYVEPEGELFRVADPRFVTIMAAVPARDVLQVRLGDAAKVITADGVALTAAVTAVTPTVDAQTGSATVTLTLAPGQPTPLPGAFAQARIMPGSQQGADLVVPDEAIQSLDGQDVVFVKVTKGFRIQPVTVGTRSAGQAAVRSGLAPDDEIAAQNAFLLKAEVNKSTADDE